MKKLGLALGGGGARSFVHIGLLRVLAAEGIPVAAVAGSSMGGLLSAMYAFDPDVESMSARAISFFEGNRLFHWGGRREREEGMKRNGGFFSRLWKRMLTGALFANLTVRNSLYWRNPASVAVDELLPDSDILQAKIPLSVNAIDLNHGCLKSFTSGNVRKASLAGMHVGIVFPPLKFEGVEYIDAAPVSPVPVNILRQMGVDKVLAVDVCSALPDMEAFHTGFDVVMRIVATSTKMLNDVEANSADLLLRPELGKAFWGDFANLKPFVKIGEDMAREALPKIKAMLEA